MPRTPRAKFSSPIPVIRTGAWLLLGALAPRAFADPKPNPTQPPASTATIVAIAPDAVAFAGIAATDLAQLKTTLERAGWPKSHVQALLNVEIQRRFNTDFTPTFEDMRPFEFWRTGPDTLPLAHLDTPERRKEIAERENKAREIFEKLFPFVEEESGPLLRWEEQRRWGNLPAEKRATVEHILKETELNRDRFLKERGRMLTRDEWNTLWALNRESRDKLAKALTIDELLDYDLRNSNTAAQMRNELDSFEPTRDEFVGIFRLRHPLELDFEDKPKDLFPDIDAKRNEAETTSTRKIAALLGPARFDDYQLSLDRGCQLLRFDGRYARITAAAVRTLYRAQLAIQAKLKDAETLPEEQKKNRVAELKTELFSLFRCSLDEEGTRRYLQEQGLWP